MPAEPVASPSKEPLNRYAPPLADVLAQVTPKWKRSVALTLIKKHTLNL